MLTAALFIVLTFVIGGIPTGYWTVLALKGVDIRKVGSGSTGATNVVRAAGKGPGLFVFLFDIFKGWAPVALAHFLDQGVMASDWSFAPHVVPPLVAVAALVGHSKSVFLGFQGGKSAATGLGTLIGLCPLGGLFTFFVWISVLFITKYVSVASILGVFSCPFWFALLHSPIPYVCYCVFGFIYVTYRHKSNLQRLMKGTEPKITDKKKEPPATPPPSTEATPEQVP
ncbi:MAG TPA: glycerol-3-phosphate 1-O-acyltransferase PlsY [Planktothrix sp.]